MTLSANDMSVRQTCLSRTRAMNVSRTRLQLAPQILDTATGLATLARITTAALHNLGSFCSAEGYCPCTSCMSVIAAAALLRNIAIGLLIDAHKNTCMFVL